MTWLTFAILASITYGFYNFFVKLASDKMHPSVALMAMTATAFFISLVYFLFLKFSGDTISFSRNAFIFAILAGVATGLAELFYLFMFQKGAPLNIGNPIAVGGTVAVAVILGVLILKEPVTAIKISGILITVLGIVILSK